MVTVTVRLDEDLSTKLETLQKVTGILNATDLIRFLIVQAYGRTKAGEGDK